MEGSTCGHTDCNLCLRRAFFRSLLDAAQSPFLLISATAIAPAAPMTAPTMPTTAGSLSTSIMALDTPLRLPLQRHSSLGDHVTFGRYSDHAPRALAIVGSGSGEHPVDERHSDLDLNGRQPQGVRRLDRTRRSVPIIDFERMRPAPRLGRGAGGRCPTFCTVCRFLVHDRRHCRRGRPLLVEEVVPHNFAFGPWWASDGPSRITGVAHTGQAVAARRTPGECAPHHPHEATTFLRTRQNWTSH